MSSLVWFRLSLVVAVAIAAPVHAEDCPECRWTLQELVQKSGYHMEEHRVTTKDGFQLTMFRIPNGQHSSELAHPSEPKPAVLLQHGLLDSAAAWTLNLPSQSLAYILADEGYDVWLGNNRGNTYSEPPCEDNIKCWDFSFDEMAQFDVPAQVEYVLEVAQKETLTYIGHSQGCAQMFAHLASTPDLDNRINLFVALEPAVYVGHISSILLKILAKLHLHDALWRVFGNSEFGGHSTLYRKITNFLCNESDLGRDGCDWAIFHALGSGASTPNLNTSRIPLYANHFPAGTSVKNLAHWGQSVHSDSFRHFDYGTMRNFWRYGSSKPPKYDLGRVRVPVAILSGSSDAFASPADVERLVRELPPGIIKWKNEIPAYNHMDAVLGTDANRLVYDDVLKLLKQCSQQNVGEHH